MDRITAAGPYLDPTAPDHGLQRAIDAVPPGGRLQLPAGEFVLRRSLVLKPGVTLAGVGPETCLTIHAEQPCVPLAATARAGEVRVRAADLRPFAPGMEVTVRDRQRSGWHATFGIVRGVERGALVLDTPMQFDYATEHEAQVVHAFPAIRARDAADVAVRHLRVRGVGPIDDLIPHNPFVQSAIHLRDCDRALIAHCTVEDWHADGFSVQGGSGARVMENIARRNACHGFHPGTGIKDSFWCGNTGDWNHGHGVFFCASCRRVVVSRGRFTRNARHGVGGVGDGDDRDCLVTGNLCARNSGAGVCSGSYGECRGNFIHANRILDNGQAVPGAGVLLQCSQENVVSCNEIGDAQSPRLPAVQIVGIEEFDDACDRNVLVGNAFRGTNEPIRRRGAHTVVAEMFPDGIPPERLALLNELLRREEEVWRAWREEAL